jgi:hypothetical protein
MADETMPKLTDDERDILDTRDAVGQIKQGYYIGFEATGVPAVDRILAALGYAGKAAHHTSDWSDDMWTDYGPIAKGTTITDLIQRAANEAAEEIRILAGQAQQR